MRWIFRLRARLEQAPVVVRLSVALFLLCVPGFAQTAAEVKGKKIIDEAIQALGGQKFLTMEDRTEHGRAFSYYRDQISGLDIATIYTRYVTIAPDKTGFDIAQREREAFGKDEDAFVLLTEKGGWNVTYHGAKDLDSDQLARYKETTLRNVFYILRVRLNEAGMIFESRGSDIADNQPADLVDITDSENRVVNVAFNQTTHLPIRQSYSHVNALYHDQDHEVTVYSRYQDSGGIEWPHEIHRERNDEKIYEMFSDTVEFNTDLTDDLFSVPEPGTAPARKKRKK